MPLSFSLIKSLGNSTAPFFQRAYQIIKPVLNHPIFHAGTTDGLSDSQKVNLKAVNVISVITAFFAVSGTLLFYIFIIPDIRVVLAGLVEAIAFACVITLNRFKFYSTATLLFYLFHNMAIVYFGLKLGGDSGVQQVGFFMVGLSFLLFEKRRDTVICLTITAISIIGIELNHRVGFIHPFKIIKDNNFTVRTVVFPIGITLNAIVIFMYQKYFMKLMRVISAKNEALEKANLSKSIYVRETSHELRTPLNAAFSMAQLLFDNKSEIENAETRKRIDCLYSATAQTLRIVNNVLDLSKIEAGYEIENLFEEIKLRDCIRELVEIPKEIANYEEKQILLKIDEELPELASFDRLSLTKIFNNLLSNAIKYTPKHGAITVHVYFKSYRIYCEVANPGTILQQDFDNLFKPFLATKRNGIESTGLGLHITKHLLEKLGGNIYPSCTEETTTFTFYMPLMVSKVELSPTPIVNYDFKGHRILVVDDNAMGLFALKRAVEQKGAEVICAGNGRQALEIISTQNPDMVISDSRMPVMGALEMLRILRADPKFQKLPVIVVTGQVFYVEEAEIERAGASACLTKPFQHKDLYALIDQQLRKSSFIV